MEREDVGVALERKRPNRNVVSDVNIDIEGYVSGYSGFQRSCDLNSLRKCAHLQIDALKLALEETKKSTLSTAKYNHIYQTLHALLSSLGSPQVDADLDWLDTTSRHVRTQLEKLEVELKDYKNNLIKESIRMGHQDLGDLYYQAGDFQNSLKSYSRTRDYCTTSKHMVDMCMNAIKVSFCMMNTAHVHSYAAKAEGTIDSPEKPLLVGKLRCYLALANLDAAKYRVAARALLEIPFELSSSLPDVLTPSDIAIYGGLCALASFDRDELKRKAFVETEPRIREVLSSFHNSNYNTCLKVLKSMKSELLLDLFLHSHVDALLESIRQKAMVQYFSPFLSVDITKMAVAFDTTVGSLEQELASLIVSNQLQARIDSHNKVLKRKMEDQRTKVFEKAVKLGVDFSVETKGLLLRVLLQRQDMYVSAVEVEH
ncbi:26S proteasome subunit RPN7-domain-containing protein [Chytridium lagenaria]|nr:26S proteasome subunit RPN7-domain-containing protein [Chytridium lagenaria]